MDVADTPQLYVRKHRHEPLAIFQFERSDDTKMRIKVAARAGVPGEHALFVNGPTPLLVYAILHARYKVAAARRAK